jgi:phosphoserine phosphatase
VSSAGGLVPGSWLPENRQRLERLIRKYGRGGANWNPEHPPLAAFDWDNTMIRNDVGEAVLYHAIRELRLKYDLGDAFWDLIPKKLGRDAWRASYEALQALPPDHIKQTPEYRRYLKLALAAYQRAKKDRSLKLDLAWRTRLFVGFEVSELEQLADQAIDYELARPLGVEYIRADAADPLPVKINTGLRPHREMFDLAAALQAAGWEVRVVSASTEWLAARFAARAGISREHVHGTLVRLADGRLTDEVTQKTWGQGKADAVLKHAGRASLLAAGDSNIDREMLDLSQGEKLVINFGREPLRAYAWLKGWMLQPPFDMRLRLR